MTHYILCIDSPDKAGLVAAVATALGDNGCNIEDAAQFNDKATSHFFMRVVFSLTDPDKKPVSLFKTAFSNIAASHNMNWHVYEGDQRVKAVLMVSKADHCLHDILYRTRTGYLPLDITAVIGNHENCRSLVEGHDIPFYFLPVSKENKKAQEKDVRKIFDDSGSELLVLARYMQILSADMCRDFAGRAINIHHSFLPGFKGARPYKQAWDRGVKIIGATAHFVTSDLDEGPIIEQETVRVGHHMSPEMLQAQGSDTEAKVLSRALLYYAQRRVFMHDNRTIIL